MSFFSQEREKRYQEDVVLIQKAQCNHDAFASLYTKYYKSVYRFILLHVRGDVDKAEELAQETFIKAFVSLDNFQIKNASYITYLRVIAKNLYINSYRRKHFFSLDEMEICVKDKTDIYKNICDKDCVCDLLEHLPEQQRKIIKERYVLGYPIKHIAHHVHKSENAVKLILSRARKKLRTCKYIAMFIISIGDFLFLYKTC